ncbi:MAG: ABC transporter ATP-binding protein [Desulfobacteraceae bacterium]|nr:ABC transporter ATP-binding protein [Desulfobacteraceae bacterium]
MVDKKRIIKLENISFSYPDPNVKGAGVKILNNLSFELNSNDKIGMIAPNGSGKTTLLHTIMGLCKPDAGSVELFGKIITKEKDFAKYRPKIGLMFQDSDDQLFNPYVIDDVAFGPLNLGFSQKEALQIARETLSNLGIEELENSIVHKLSGGQKRLVALASVLAMEPEALLLDEPTAGLDMEVKTRIEGILKNLEIAFLVVAHDFNFLKKISSKIFSMREGKVLMDDQIHIHQHEHIHKYGHDPHTHV